MLGPIAFAALILTPPQLSNNSSDRQSAAAMQRCVGSGSVLEQITSCSKAIGSGRLTQDELAQAYFTRATAYGRSGDHRKAVNDSSEAIRLKLDYADAYAFRGFEFTLISDNQHATADFSRLIELTHGSQAYNLRGAAYLRAGDHRRAIADFGEAIRLNGTDWQAYNNRAAAYTSAGDNQHALADLDAALRIEPGNAGVLMNRARLFQKQEQYDKAIADFERVAAIAPDNADAHNGACWYRVANLGKELDRARAHCDQAVRLNPKNGSYLDSRGMVGLKQHRFQDAWSDYDAAVRLDPKRASPLYGRAMAEIRLGQKEKAEADIAAATLLDPKIAASYAQYGVKP